MHSTQVLPGDPAYPEVLAALAGESAPPLFVRGTLPRCSGIAIVGTREASHDARAFATQLSAEFSAEGFAVWSGGAFGIDAAAHEAALTASGVTVVVMGGGLDRPYPAEHVRLYERVLDQGGALLSRVADGTPPTPPGFLKRNYLLAALTVATVVVEAGIVSGARSTASAARKLGRPLCVVPHAPWAPRGAGCALELARGAIAITCSADVLRAVGRTPPKPRPKLRARKSRSQESPLFPEPPRTPQSGPPLEDDLDPDERAILDALGAEPSHVDNICERARRPAPLVQSALLTLTLRTVVVEGPAGFFRRAPPS